MNANYTNLAALSLLAVLSQMAVAQPYPRNTNQARKFKSVITGGSGNLVVSNSVASFVGAGRYNRADGNENFVGAGSANSAVGDFGSAVVGGAVNSAQATYSFVGGGSFNSAAEQNSVVCGGQNNTNSGFYGFIGSGLSNSATAQYAVIPGGYSCEAGLRSFAAGMKAKATQAGSFVWSGDMEEDTTSFGENTFTVRCEGGARFYTASGTAVAANLPPGGTSFAALSDSNAKTKITAIKPREILAKLSRLPVTEWEYKHDPQRRYIGPMSQDFRAAFGLGYDDKSISTLDSDGVMYAAIQGLVEELKERDRAIAELKTQNADFAARSREQGAQSKAEMESLKAELRAIRNRLSQLPPAP